MSTEHLVVNDDGTPPLEPRRLAALASGLLLIDDARLYGFVKGGPDVDRDRCSEVLEELARDGVVPTLLEAEQAALDLIAGLNSDVEEAAT